MWSQVIEDQMARARVAQRLAAAQQDRRLREAGASASRRTRGRRRAEPAQRVAEPVCQPAHARAWA